MSHAVVEQGDDLRGRVLPYRTAGAGGEEDPPLSPWLITSWAVFIASVVVVAGGAAWLRRPGSTDAYADAITYAMAVVILGLLSVACLIGTAIALLLNRGRRDTGLALIPWVLTILTYAMPLLIAVLS